MGYCNICKNTISYMKDQEEDVIHLHNCIRRFRKSEHNFCIESIFYITRKVNIP